jgi:hypothetical protein
MSTTTYVEFGVGTKGWGINSNLSVSLGSPHYPRLNVWEKYVLVRGGASGNKLFHNGMLVSNTDTTTLKSGTPYSWGLITDMEFPTTTVGAQYAWNRALSDTEAKIESLNKSKIPIFQNGLKISVGFHGYHVYHLGGGVARLSGFYDENLSNVQVSDNPPWTNPSGLIFSPGNWPESDTSWFEVQLDELSLDPQVDTDFKLKVRYSKSGSDTINLMFALLDGSTIIQEWTVEDISESIVTNELVVEEANAALITFPAADLRVRGKKITVSQ